MVVSRKMVMANLAGRDAAAVGGAEWRSGHGLRQ
jgi:hypothetical protein